MFDNRVAKERCHTFWTYDKTPACTETAQARKEKRSWLSKMGACLFPCFFINS